MKEGFLMKKFTKMLLLALVFIGVASSLTACGSTEDKLLGLWKIKGAEYILFTDKEDKYHKGWKKCLLNNFRKMDNNYKKAKKDSASRDYLYKVEGDKITIRPTMNKPWDKINNKWGYDFKGIEIKNNEMHPKVRGYFLKSVDKKYVSGGKLTKLADLDKDE